jgi:Ca2+/H+ antiporter, TMEM165/GDT1 family
LIDWANAGSPLLAAFLASLVEATEALTVVLAVGTVRGWRSALVGTALALAILLVLTAALGPALQNVPLARLQLVVGVLLLLFGMRWLRKALLRAAGVIPLHDEQAVFSSETRSLSRAVRSMTLGLDATALAAAFKIVMLEGIEVVFIVLAIGATSGHLLAAGVGAAGAVAVVATLGLVLHRPLALVPENSIKFAVGILLCAFGTFWSGEGVGIAWPGDDWSILALVAGFVGISAACTWLCRSVTGGPTTVT